MPSFRNALLPPKGSSYTAPPLRLHGRPAWLVCHSVGTWSYASTVLFSNTLFAENATFALRPCEYLRFTVISRLWLLTIPSGRLFRTRPALPRVPGFTNWGYFRISTWRCVVVPVKNALPAILA